MSELAALAERAGVPAPRLVRGSLTAFRHRVRLAVRGRTNNPKLGLFESGSHRVVHIPSCVVHHPLINDVARTFRSCLVEQRISPYSDTAHAGLVRYLQVVVERRTQTAQVVVVANDTTPDALAPLFEMFTARLGARLHSLFWNGNPERTNTILGPHWHAVSGPPSLVEHAEGVNLHYPPGAFGQSNLQLAETMNRRVRDLVHGSARVLELYAGVGAIGLPLAESAARLELNELSADSLAGLRLGIADLPGELAARVHVLPGPATDATPRIAEADAVIVDPPRRGLDAAVLAALAAAPPARLVYVSCGLPSFLTEARALLDAGLVLEGLEAYLMFPFTDHIETLAWFRKA
jgi:23S rRNA (uracil1939-C5)-methyltransferase